MCSQRPGNDNYRTETLQALVLKLRMALALKKISANGIAGFQQKATRTKALIALALVSFLWGTTWIASREGVKHMPALQLSAIRQFIGGFAYIIFLPRKDEHSQRDESGEPFLFFLFSISSSATLYLPGAFNTFRPAWDQLLALRFPFGWS